jgi:hypothetical protein
MERKPAEGSLC